MGEQIGHFEELKVYRKAFTLQQEVFESTKGWPSEERYALTDQVRRSSRSVGANIAEAWRKRRYEAYFVSKLTDADAELAETQHWLRTAQACGYLAGAPHDQLRNLSEHVGRMLGAMMQNPGPWLRPAREA